MVKTTFEQTPAMSTYLVAFVVSDFNSVANNNSKTPMRVFTHDDFIYQTKFALFEGVRLLQTLSQYVKVPYVLEKMDHVAIPDFFSEGLNELIKYDVFLLEEKKLLL